MLSHESKECIFGIGIDPEINLTKDQEGDTIRQGFFDLFNAMANEARIKNSPAQTMIIPMARPGAIIAPGEYMAELHFVVRKVGNDSNSGNEIEQEATSEGISG